MKFFIDTANVSEIRKAAEMGLIQGVTTNPSLLAREGRDPIEVLREITKIVDGPVNAEVVALDVEGMVREGLAAAKIADNICIKIPMTLEGLQAIRRLTSDGLRVNTTLIFSPIQALMAAKAGANYVSPFVGRLDDISTDGMDLIRTIDQACRDRLDALALAIEQKAGDVLRHRRPALGATEVRR